VISTEGQRIQFLEKIFGPGKLFTNSKGSKNLCVVCPNCVKQNKNSAINGQRKLAIEINNEKNHCWVCDKRYKTVFPWIVFQRRLNLQKEYEELFERELETKKEEEQYSISLPNDFMLIGQNLESKNFLVDRAANYLFSRGMSIKDLWRYKCGISDEYEYRDRIIIPSFTIDGNLNYFLARAIYSSDMKYVNCGYDKNEIVFNEFYVDWNKELILVEGPMDLLNIEENATCLLGSSLSRESRIFNFIIQNKTPVVLCLDLDAVEKQRKIAELLYSYDIPTKIIKIDRKDPGLYSNQEFKDLKQIEWSWKENFLEKIERTFK
jgi:hypothetical protein